MNWHGIGLCQAKAAGEIPVIHPFWQGRTALASDIFSDVMLARLKQAVGVSALNVELEYFIVPFRIKI